MRTFPFVIVAFVILSNGATAQVTTFADSFDGWSFTGTQGENGWTYGYYNLTQDQTLGDGVYGADDFVEFEPQYWSGNQWDLTPAASGPWTELGRETTHPNGTNSLPNEEHWTIRRWTSDVDATDASITWRMRKTNVNCGNGVTGYLFLNGEELDTAVIDGGDGIGVTREAVADLKVGDVVDLALGPTGPNAGRDDGCDGSANRLTVTSEPPDQDDDGIADSKDNCITVANAGQENADGDILGDACDNCPDRKNPDQGDSDRPRRCLRSRARRRLLHRLVHRRRPGHRGVVPRLLQPDPGSDAG